MALTADDLQEAVDAVERYGSQTKAAEKLGINFKTFHTRYRRATQEGFEPTLAARYEAEEELELEQDSGMVEFPNLLSEQPSAEEIIEYRKQRFQQRKQAKDSRKWMRYRINTNEPFALAFVGDPHIDDNGCNWPLLDRDMRILRETPHLYGVCLGDVINNWAGKLAEKIHPHQEVTRDQAWILCEWFFNQRKFSGESAWLLLLQGNHCSWSNTHGTGDPMQWLMRGGAPLEDWQAQFIVETPNGSEFPIWAAHDFKGNSIYNQLHGNLRKCKFTGHEADLYISGDKHNWAIFHAEDQEGSGRVANLARARGYKYIDHYAENLGFGNQEYGASITAVFDPEEEGPKAMKLFPDMEEASEFLAFKRSKK